MKIHCTTRVFMNRLSWIYKIKNWKKLPIKIYKLFKYMISNWNCYLSFILRLSIIIFFKYSKKYFFPSIYVSAFYMNITSKLIKMVPCLISFFRLFSIFLGTIRVISQFFQNFLRNYYDLHLPHSIVLIVL